MKRATGCTACEKDSEIRRLAARRTASESSPRPAAQRSKCWKIAHYLAVDFGDAPDTGLGTSSGNYNTLATDNGASHTIIAGLRMGANVDGDDGTLQNSTANADDVSGACPTMKTASTTRRPICNSPVAHSRP